MKVINKIFWQQDRIGILSNHIEAETHKHWMLQLFLGLEDAIEIIVNGKWIRCNCIVIDKNVPHSFSTKKKMYYSAIIDPSSMYAKQLTSRMNAFGYWLCDK